jgi:hypothetical protein
VSACAPPPPAPATHIHMRVHPAVSFSPAPVFELTLDHSSSPVSGYLYKKSPYTHAWKKKWVELDMTQLQWQKSKDEPPKTVVRYCSHTAASLARQLDRLAVLNFGFAVFPLLLLTGVADGIVNVGPRIPI